MVARPRITDAASFSCSGPVGTRTRRFSARESDSAGRHERPGENSPHRGVSVPRGVSRGAPPGTRHAFEQTFVLVFCTRTFLVLHGPTGEHIFCANVPS